MGPVISAAAFAAAFFFAGCDEALTKCAAKAWYARM